MKLILVALLICGCAASPVQSVPVASLAPLSDAALILAHSRVPMAAAHFLDEEIALASAAPDETSRRDALAAVNDRWAGVSEAWDALVSAERSTRRGEEPDRAALQIALCGLWTALPARHRGVVFPREMGCP